MGFRDKKRGAPLDDEGDSNVISNLKKLQQQMNFLERKIDRLVEMMEGKPDRERHSSKGFGEHKPSYGSKDQKFSRGYTWDEDRRTGGQHKDRDLPSDKTYGKKSYGKSSGKPFGKPSGKPFGKPGVAKKKFSSIKKKI